MRGRIDQILFDPQILLIVFKEDAAFSYGPRQRDKRFFGCALILLVSTMSIRPQKKRNSLSLRQSGIPWGLERVTIIPVKMMVPHPQPVSILLQVGGKPIGGRKSLLPTNFVTALAETVVIREPPLRNCNRVVLQADGSVVVEHGNASAIVVPGVVRFLAKQHVILAKPAGSGARIDLGHLVPERQLASSGAEIGAEDT